MLLAIAVLSDAVAARDHTTRAATAALVVVLLVLIVLHFFDLLNFKL